MGLGMDAHIVIDTGRNGVPDARSDCSSWCNNRGAGAGHFSTSMTEGDGIVDAYYYLKTPGESDGCTQILPDGKVCPRFDVFCGSQDSLGSRADEPRAPEAGGWFDYQVRQLADFADFGDQLHAPKPVPSLPSQLPAGPADPDHGVTEPEVEPRPQPQPQNPGGGSCCWGSSCAPPASWCAESQDHCVGNCNGEWHPADIALASVGPKKSPRAVLGRPGRLRAHKESMLIQTLGNLLRKVHAEL